MVIICYCDQIYYAISFRRFAFGPNDISNIYKIKTKYVMLKLIWKNCHISFWFYLQLVPLFILQVESAFHVCMYSDYNLVVCSHLESFWASTKQILDKAVFHFIGMKEYHIKGMGRSFANQYCSNWLWVHESVSRLAYVESATLHFTIRKKSSLLILYVV